MSFLSFITDVYERTPVIHMVYIFLIPFLVVLSAVIIKKITNQVSYALKYNKMKKEVLLNHCEGPHNWIRLYIPQLKNEDRVCKDCGYCSELDGYISIPYIKQVDFQRKQMEEYENWKEDRILNLSLEHKMVFSDMKELSNKVLAFKRDYFVEKIEKNLKKDK